jgi:hypothetical protein
VFPENVTRRPACNPAPEVPVNDIKLLGADLETHPVLSKERDVLFRELTASLVVVNTFSTIATLELITDDTGFHGSDPGFTYVRVAGSQPR